MRARVLSRIVSGLFVVIAGAGCSAPERPTAAEPAVVTATSRQSLVSSNGIWTNGLSTNGIWTNGIWTNGIWTNGIWTNGIWTNGIWTNGIWTNGIWTNGIWTNGIWTNGIWTNGIWTNGIWTNGIWTNGIWTNGLAGDTLTSNRYTRQLLQYVYACAMPAAVFPADGSAPTSYDTTLDPNSGTLECASDGSCDVGYSCSADNTCVIPLTGAIGLGINADGSTWWGSGTCDESCQRWVSACVLARTNAYGVHVNISMRAPADAPQAIKDALAVSDVERNGDGAHVAYSLREGAYYGNIFATTPGTLDATGKFVPSTTGASGSTANVIEESPSFYACAGPGSNIPEVTKRFCSSQGDQVVINVPGVCLGTNTESGTCAGADTNPASTTYGAIQDCYTNTSQNGTPYKEVITVFLQEPIAVCGNAVCEPPEDATSCPSDCHLEGWAKSIAGDHYFNGNSTSAVDPIDSSTVVAGFALASSELLVDGTASPPITLPADPGSSSYDVVLIKYASDGTYLWGKRFPVGAGLSPTNGLVRVAPDQSIFLVGGTNDPPYGGCPTCPTRLWFAKFRKDGSLVSSWPVTIGAATGYLYPYAAQVDSKGDLIVRPVFEQGPSATLGATTFTGSASPQGDYFGVFVELVAKVCGNDRIDCALGDVEWAVAAGNDSGSPSLAIDGNDDVLLAGRSATKLNGATGATLWSGLAASAGAIVTDLASDPRDPTHDVYATGFVNATSNYGFTQQEFYLGKYSADGMTRRWEKRVPSQCPPFSNCNNYVAGQALSFDAAGNVVVGGGFGGRNASPVTIDFGAGVFNPYHAENLFLASYRSVDGAFFWAKDLPVILGLNQSFYGSIGMLANDARGHLALSGAFGGSMQLDDRLLVSTVPEADFFYNTFVGSFKTPSPVDTTSPAIGAAADQNGTPIDTIPGHIVAQATSSAGAVVFFMPPTAIDTGYAGTNVACSPPPNTMFPIGTTTVTCTATDPLGNGSSAIFTVTVTDEVPPMLSGVSTDVSLPATGASGATLTFPSPTAIDQVDRNPSVTCKPESGSVFPVGTTTVLCSAADASKNQSTAAFHVVVTASPDVTSPVLTLPEPLSTTATSQSGAIVTYAASAFDNYDGVVPVACTPASGSVFPVGTTTVMCFSTDVHGNVATGSFPVHVQYSWSGILQPIDADGNSIFKLGRTVPVKFQLTGSSAGITNAFATLTVAKITSTVTGSDIEALSTAAATTGNVFVYDSGQYVFNLDTKSLSQGTWRLSVDLHDGVSRTANISLR